MPVMSNREYRNLADVLAPSEDMTVRGYATTYNDPYILYRDDEVELWETVDPNAFSDTSFDDVIFQFDHVGRVYARTKNHTLVLRSDEHGLSIEANLGGTSIGRELYEEIKGGYINKMSFGFTVKEDEWSKRVEDGVEKNYRRILKIDRLYDVSCVSIPANDATSISVRSLSDGLIERLNAERQEQRRQAELAEKRNELIQRIERIVDGDS